MHSPPNGHAIVSHAKTSLSPRHPEHKGSQHASLLLQQLDFDLPGHLHQFLTTTSNPDEIYSQVTTRNDRRLRLLIRRYVNQIQYGCQNSKCDVPSCLSYRKTKTKGPLRKYTDLSARTLACSLIEQFGQQGKEFETGLCWNDPVIPWYEDPVQLKERRQTISRKHELTRPQYGHTPKHSVGDSRKSLSRSGVNPSDDAPKASQTPRTSQERAEHGHTSSHPPHGLPNRADKDEAGATSANSDDLGALSQGNDKDNARIQSVDERAPSNTLREKDSPSVVRDPASFTQTLHALLPLRDLSSTQRNLHNDYDHSELCEKHSTIGVSDSGQTSKSGLPRSTTHLPRVLTFKLLPYDVLRWLSENSVPKTQEGSTVSRFVSQSIYYCLSDPVRLSDSAALWRDADPADEQVSSQGTDSDDLDPTQKGTSSSQGPKTTAVAVHSHTTGVPSSISTLRGSNHFWPNRFTFLCMLHDMIPNSDLLDHLFLAMQKTLFLPNLTERATFESSHKKSTSKHERKQDKLIVFHEALAADTCILALFAVLVATWPNPRSLGILQDQALHELYLKSRKSDTIYPSSGGPAIGSQEHRMSSPMYSRIVDTIDRTHDWHVIRLMEAVATIIGHWANVRHSHDAQSESKNSTVVDRMLKDFAECFTQFDEYHIQPRRYNAAAAGSLRLFRDLLQSKWDRAATIRKAGPVWGALHFLSKLFQSKADFNLADENFHMPFLADAFDKIDMPVEWLSFRADNRKTHILAFSFLFEPARLVEYFRAVHLETMRKSYENACIVYTNARQFLHGQFPVYGAKEVLSTMRPHMARYFVLSIRRDNVLEDAMNQVWRRQRQELMRPLRLRLGFEEGEEGVDHGGVQQEFFRLLFAEALTPEHGIFDIDEITRMTWFRPGSLEQLYRIEALGVLFSLAIYNCVTLPVTFPLAFYRKLLGLKVKKLEHIRDGWPELAKSLQILLDWSAGDVGDAISRTYEFSYEAFGTTISIDMQKVGKDDIWPLPARKRGKEKAKTASFGFPPSPSLTPSTMSPYLEPSLHLDLSRISSSEIKGTSTPDSIATDILDSEAALVTNENREQYVKDYIFWLTDKSIRPQYEAFSKGIFTCLDCTALSIFTPEALKRLVGGYQEINIEELERSTSYEGFEQDEKVIKNFWEVVRNYGLDQHRKLLEFVTASDRVPVTGIASIKFEIDKNGEDDKMLPTSSTCYGRLLLPAYSTKEILEAKLTFAIENAVGFGNY